MARPVGLSYLYPVVPIMCLISMVLLLALIPGFWKTRIFALLALVGWLFIGNLLVFIGMVGWRGSVHDAPVIADILVILWYIWPVGAFGSMAVFSKFVWQRLQPMSARQLYDNRRRNNRIDAFITLLLPLLWTPSFLSSCPARYFITEDIGPEPTVRADWPGFLISILPTCLSAAAMGVFNALALISHFRLKSQKSKPLLTDDSVRTRKLLIMSIVNLLLSLFTIGFLMGATLKDRPVSTWDAPLSIIETIENLKVVRFVDRLYLDMLVQYGFHPQVSRSLSMPLIGFYLFAWFGFSAEARKSYWQVLTCVTGAKPKTDKDRISWWARFQSKSWPDRKENDRLPTTGDKAMHYKTGLRSETAMDHFLNDFIMDIRPEFGLPRRPLSCHKPPLVPFTPAKTTGVGETAELRLSPVTSPSRSDRKVRPKKHVVGDFCQSPVGPTISPVGYSPIHPSRLAKHRYAH